MSICVKGDRHRNRINFPVFYAPHPPPPTTSCSKPPSEDGGSSPERKSMWARDGQAGGRRSEGTDGCDETGDGRLKVKSARPHIFCLDSPLRHLHHRWCLTTHTHTLRACGGPSPTDLHPHPHSLWGLTTEVECPFVCGAAGQHPEERSPTPPPPKEIKPNHSILSQLNLHLNTPHTHQYLSCLGCGGVGCRLTCGLRSGLTSLLHKCYYKSQRGPT